eukprot:547240-Prymnesium_polylepis.1
MPQDHKLYSLWGHVTPDWSSRPVGAAQCVCSRIIRKHTSFRQKYFFHAQSDDRADGIMSARRCPERASASA